MGCHVMSKVIEPRLILVSQPFRRVPRTVPVHYRTTLLRHRGVRKALRKNIIKNSIGVRKNKYSRKCSSRSTFSKNRVIKRKHALSS